MISRTVKAYGPSRAQHFILPCHHITYCGTSHALPQLEHALTSDRSDSFDVSQQFVPDPPPSFTSPIPNPASLTPQTLHTFQPTSHPSIPTIHSSAGVPPTAGVHALRSEFHPITARLHQISLGRTNAGCVVQLLCFKGPTASVRCVWL